MAILASVHTQTPLGIIAGGGNLPRVLAEAARKDGVPVVVIGLVGSVVQDGWLEGWDHILARPEQVGRILKALRKRGVKDVVMIGHVRRPSIKELRPDWTGLWWLWKLSLALRSLGDDGLLRTIRGLLEKAGFTLKSIQDFVGDVLAPDGVLGNVAVPPDAREDITKGVCLSQMIGRLDIGQAVVVQNGLVLGMEAIEGTDALITRCGALKRKGRGPVLVKTAKPQQDRALDLPTLGTETIVAAAREGFCGVAYSAGSVLMADVPRMVELADANGLFLVGVAPADLERML